MWQGNIRAIRVSRRGKVTCHEYTSKGIYISVEVYD